MATIASQSIRAIGTASRSAINDVKALDAAITDLRIATGKSHEQVAEMVQGYNTLAKNLGATTTQITSAADTWLRQGHSISDTNQLIRDSMVLSKIGQIDAADSAKYLTSALKGYKLEAEDAISVIDKISAIDITSATDAAGLAEAMSRTAVTADLAGVSMEKLLGYLATVGEVTQKSMSTVGESFKTIFTRMSSIKATA